MQTTAYVSSNPERKAELDAQIATLDEHIKMAEKQLQGCRASTPEAKTLKKYIAERTEQMRKLLAQLPEQLFCEANALNDLEQAMVDAITAWEDAKATWLAQAAVNPAYAVEYAAEIVARQAVIEYTFRLQRHWPALAERDGRTLATFRKAYDEIAEARQSDMLSKLTGCRSTCAFHNAVEHQQGRALAQHQQYDDRILLHLTWCEFDAARMTHAA